MWGWSVKKYVGVVGEKLKYPAHALAQNRQSILNGLRVVDDFSHSPLRTSNGMALIVVISLFLLRFWISLD